MQQILLTRNQVSLVDDIDFEAVVALGKWCYTKSGYAVHYWHDSIGARHTIYLHRFIYARILGHAIPPTLQIDHCSAREQGKLARLDNQRHNLRLATRSQNQAAKGSQINSASGQKGCTLRSGKYDVRLRYYHHRLYLGRFVDFDLAVAVYGYAHRLLWEEFSSETPSNIPLSSALQDKIDKQIGLVLHRNSLSVTVTASPIMTRNDP